MISINDVNKGRACMLHAAIIEQWDFYGEPFATTLCAAPHHTSAVFSVTHLPTGLHAVGQLQEWDAGPREFDKVVLKHGKGGVLDAVGRAYVKVRTNPPPIVHPINCRAWVYQTGSIFELWFDYVAAGTFLDFASATQRAHVLNSGRHTAQNVPSLPLPVLPKL